MNTFINELKKTTLSTKEVFLTSEILERIPSEQRQQAITNAKLVRAYFFTYSVNGIEVSGFAAHLRHVAKKQPVVVFNRGGTADFGIVKPGNLFTRIAEIVQMGYVVVGSNYPGNSLSQGVDEHGGQSDKEAVIKLYDIIRSTALCDETRIGMYGESRGGMLAYQCIQSVDWIKACVTVGAVTNLWRSIGFRPEMKKVYSTCFDISSQKEFALRSAVKNVSKFSSHSNLCILHGAADQKVSPLDALELGQVLCEAGINYSLHIFSGGNHTLSNREDALYVHIGNWFREYL